MTSDWPQLTGRKKEWGVSLWLLQLLCKNFASPYFSYLQRVWRFHCLSGWYKHHLLKWWSEWTLPGADGADRLGLIGWGWWAEADRLGWWAGADRLGLMGWGWWAGADGLGLMGWGWWAWADRLVGWGRYADWPDWLAVFGLAMLSILGFIEPSPHYVSLYKTCSWVWISQRVRVLGPMLTIVIIAIDGLYSFN